MITLRKKHQELHSDAIDTDQTSLQSHVQRLTQGNPALPVCLWKGLTTLIINLADQTIVAIRLFQFTKLYYVIYHNYCLTERFPFLPPHLV